MKIFIQNGQYRFINYTDIKDQLEPGNYTVMKDIMGFYLQKSNSSNIPSKIYGNLESESDKYIDRFKKINKNIGISLNGEKGSGKTLLARLICEKIKLPVIIINTPYTGSDFVNFIDGIDQECVVLFDEFDKMYPGGVGSNNLDPYDDDDDSFLQDENHSKKQTDLLKIFDGGTKSKKLFILTSNKSSLSEYMKNRPSRIRYKKEFTKMSSEFLIEVLNDKLENKSYLDDFIFTFNKYFGFNLDTALILIDEVNLTGIKPSVAILDMNITPDVKKFDVVLYDKNGEKWETFRYYPSPYYVDNLYINFHKDVSNNNSKNLDGFDRKNFTINERVSEFNVEQTENGYVLIHKLKGFKLIYTATSLIF